MFAKGLYKGRFGHTQDQPSFDFPPRDTPGATNGHRTPLGTPRGHHVTGTPEQHRNNIGRSAHNTNTPLEHQDTPRTTLGQHGEDTAGTPPPRHSQIGHHWNTPTTQPARPKHNRDTIGTPSGHHQNATGHQNSNLVPWHLVVLL